MTAISTTRAQSPAPAQAYTGSRDAKASATPTLPQVQALPRPIDAYAGPYPKVAPKPSYARLETRINGLLQQVVPGAEEALWRRTGQRVALKDVAVEMVDRRGFRTALRNQDGHGPVMAFLLSWVVAVSYAPDLGRVLVVAPTAKRYTDATLAFQLTRALCAGAIALRHKNFYNYIARCIVSFDPSSYSIYATRAWAYALGEGVAQVVAANGRKGPWWQRLALFCLWPAARITIGPMRLARSFVAIQQQMTKDGRHDLVERMFAFPSLCNALYSPRGVVELTASYTPEYQRSHCQADVAYLRQFNAHAGSTRFTVES